MTSPTTTARRPPVVIAHRGASFDAPENTIAAFERAAALGADAIELDVHLSRDRQPVVIHDFTLERTTDGDGSVGGRTVRELKRLDAGGWRGPGFRGQRIQTLQEVLERFRGRLEFWIELRAGSDLYPEIEDRVVSMLEIYDVLECAVVQSLDHAALARIRDMDRAARLGGLIDHTPVDAAAVSQAGWHAVCPNARLVSAEAAAAFERAGLAWYPWTVNEPAEMDRLIELRASGIVTDRPDVLRDRLTRGVFNAGGSGGTRPSPPR